MKILGTKVTHDAAVCLIEDGEVVFNVEFEKLDNNPRYTALDDLSQIGRVLGDFGYELNDVNYLSIDGWNFGELPNHPLISVNGYNEAYSGGVIDSRIGTRFLRRPAVSYKHMYNHMTSAICTSGFSSCHVLTWDGGQNPRLHYWDGNRISPVDSGGLFYGYIYGMVGYYFGPYKEEGFRFNPEERRRVGQYDWPGKLMSYMSVGVRDPEILERMGQIYRSAEIHFGYGLNECRVLKKGDFEHAFLSELKLSFPDRPHADVLYNLHLFLEEGLLGLLRKHVPEGAPVCFVGGNALNIKWNSRIRESYNLWVPPFPNDCGGAFGAACSEYIYQTGRWSVDWSVYSGPEFINNNTDWIPSHCGPEEMARFFAAHPSTPVVAAFGRAESGPRALGHRSILCSAALASNKHFLNRIKRRELFRPVAPICAEGMADKFFSPGGSDPYMLYDHVALDAARAAAPAVIHTDGTARLQTVGPGDCPIIWALLRELEALTGVPILCNTSANFNGSGFFPDFRSITELDYIDHIWDGERLYTRPAKNKEDVAC